MAHDFDMRRRPRPPGRYRPAHAWLGYPGDGATIRAHRPRRWAFRWRQLRILLLAMLIGVLAWSQLPSRGAQPVAASRSAR